jgi:hypothetical protein
MRDVYSVWNWDKGRFDYYAVNRHRPSRQKSGYPPSQGLKGVGETPEQSVNPLPAGARYIGEGDEAIGTMAQPKKRSATLFVAASLVALWLLN